MLSLTWHWSEVSCHSWESAVLLTQQYHAVVPLLHLPLLPPYHYPHHSPQHTHTPVNVRCTYAHVYTYISKRSPFLDCLHEHTCTCTCIYMYIYTHLFAYVSAEVLARGFEECHQARVHLTPHPLRVHLSSHLHTLQCSIKIGERACNLCKFLHVCTRLSKVATACVVIVIRFLQIGITLQVYYMEGRRPWGRSRLVAC